MELQFVIFNLGEESFGVDISVVEGIIKMQAITRIPHSPACIEGVTNLRGQVLPVLDLRQRLGLPAEAPTPASRIVVVELTGRAVVGMIVDSVNEVLRIPEEAVVPPPPLVTTVHSEFLRGIARLEGRLVILLDLERVLSVEEQEALQDLPN